MHTKLVLPLRALWQLFKLLALGLALLPQVHARGDDGYRIIQAHYGTEYRHVDVTDRLRELAQRNARFRVSNDTFGVDPDEGRVKALRIYAKGPNGMTRTFEYREGAFVDGSQFEGWGGGNWGQGGWTGGWGNNAGNNSNNGYNRPGYGRQRLEITSASYGAGYRTQNIRGRLQSLVDDGRLEVQISNDMVGNDPVPNVKKVATVRYRVNGGREQTRVIREGEWLSIP